MAIYSSTGQVLGVCIRATVFNIICRIIIEDYIMQLCYVLFVFQI